MGRTTENKKAKLKLLLVDDDIDAGLITILGLREKGWRPNHVTNGQEALDWIERHGHPDVILLDLNMPVMSGQEFMKAYSGPAIIIVTTAWAKEMDLPYDPFQVVAKPFYINDITSCIEQALLAAVGDSGPSWARLLPCVHSCVGVSLKKGTLTLQCYIPGCDKSRSVNANNLDFQTLAELTVAIAQDTQAREETGNLS